MTAIFISHSSADNEAALRMKAWLEEQGHTLLFLDFDPEAGIRAGEIWEQTIYQRLHQCQAVIALLTPNWLASKWCFAELVQTRVSGKAIFPVKVMPCDANGVFSDIQHIDLTNNLGEGYQSLALGLKDRGLDPRDVFDWDPERPLYPGLEAFKEEDAAIFFGRGEEILKGIETVHALRRRDRGVARSVLFLGASGSGKSSLVRAGLIPRLKKTPSEWLPLAPFRPQDDPLDEMALVIADTFEVLEKPRDLGDIRKALNAAAEQEPADGKVLLSLARELSIAAKHREATVVLTVDQAEELFGYCAPNAATRFLRLLRAALEASDRQLMAVATLRSDFLGEFQTHPVLHDPAYDHDFLYQAVPVDPMPERNFVEIIQGPARLAGLRLEEGLIEAMVRDTGDRDALPLLAFTLRRLYERYSDDGLLEIREYDELGRLEGAIRGEAERILVEANPSDQDLNQLRSAFVPAMVRVSADGGYARRRAYVEEMPPGASRLLERFVNARLLVRGRDKDDRETLEVAHEALLRTWPQLTAWLAEDQDKLRLLDSLQRAAKDWDKGSRSADLLLHRDSRLHDVEALIINRRFAVRESSLEKRYLDACMQAQQAREAAERDEQERRVRDAKQIATEQKKTAQRTRVGLVIALALALIAFWQYWAATNSAKDARRKEAKARMAQIDAEKQARRALSRQLSAQALNAAIEPNEVNGYFDRALLLAVEAYQMYETPEIWGSLLRIMQTNPDAMPFQLSKVTHGSQSGMLNGELDPNGNFLIMGGAGGSDLTILDLKTGDYLPVPAEGYAWYGAEFSSDGNTLAIQANSPDTIFVVWDLAVGKFLILQGVATNWPHWWKLSGDGKALAVISEEMMLTVWDVAAGKPMGKPQPLSLPEEGKLAFSPDGKVLAIETKDEGIILMVWDLAVGKFLKLQGVATNRPQWWELSGDGKALAVVSEEMMLTVWDVAAGKPMGKPQLLPEKGKLAFSPDGKVLAIASNETATLWDIAARKPLDESWIFPENQLHVEHIKFSQDGEKLAVWAFEGRPEEIDLYGPHRPRVVTLWNIAARKQLVEPLKPTAFSAYLVKLVNWVDGDASGISVTLWDIAAKKQIGETKLGDEEWIVGLSADFDTVALSRGVQSKWFEVSRWNIAETKPFAEKLGDHDYDDDDYDQYDDYVQYEDLFPIIFSADGKTAAFLGIYSADGKTAASFRSDDVTLFNIATGKHIVLPQWIAAKLKSYDSFVFSADLNTLAIRDKVEVTLWDIAAERQISEFQLQRDDISGASDMAFSQDGRKLAVIAGGTLTLWDTVTEKQIGESFDSAEAQAGAFSGDLKVLAVANGAVTLWDTATGKQIGESLHDDSFWAEAAAFGLDDKVLAVAGTNTARLWNPATGEPLGEQLRRPGDEIPAYETKWWEIVSLLFSADGKTLVVNNWGQSKGEKWLWHLDLKARACRIARRNLTHTEWQRYMGDKTYQRTCPNLPVPD